MYDDAAPLGANAISTPSTIKQRLSAVANLLLNADRLKQAPKTELSISVTESGMVTVDRLKLIQYLQPVITQYFASNKSEIWS